MNTCIKNLFLFPALSAGLGLVPAEWGTAQTFTALHSFTAAIDPLPTKSDGAKRVARLILSSNTLYGTAADGVAAVRVLAQRSSSTPTVRVLRTCIHSHSLATTEPGPGQLVLSGAVCRSAYRISNPGVELRAATLHLPSQDAKKYKSL